MASWPILSVTTFLPLAGALFIMLIRGEGAAESRNARWVALWTTLITFAISLILIWRFDPSSPEFQFVEKKPWLGGTITYHLGVDGISARVLDVTRSAMRLQSGYLYHYAFAMLIGVALIITWFMFYGGAWR